MLQERSQKPSRDVCLLFLNVSFLQHGLRCVIPKVRRSCAQPLPDGSCCMAAWSCQFHREPVSWRMWVTHSRFGKALPSGHQSKVTLPQHHCRCKTDAWKSQNVGTFCRQLLLFQSHVKLRHLIHLTLQPLLSITAVAPCPSKYPVLYKAEIGFGTCLLWSNLTNFQEHLSKKNNCLITY